jgi:hypothetical protein
VPRPMKVSVVRGGGVAGIVQTTIADSEALAPDDAEVLRAKVDEAGFFDLPPDAGGSPGGPDRFVYAVTVEDDDRAHTVRRAEPDLPDGLGELIAWVSSVPGRRDELSPPG